MSYPYSTSLLATDAFYRHTQLDNQGFTRHHVHCYMRPKELMKLGIGRGQTLELAIQAVATAAKMGMKKGALRRIIRGVVKNPETYLDDPEFGQLASCLIEQHRAKKGFEMPDKPAPYHKWGSDFEPSAEQQLVRACTLPISIAGALMPDAHQGYGLPIGGVLATKDAVIPYAVGVDIACRMKMSVLDWPLLNLERKRDHLVKAIEKETRFGIGATFKNRRKHRVVDWDWSFTKVVAGLKDKAHSQLGTSGSGNHFVEFGKLTLEKAELGLEKGVYLALLSHSGSRGAGSSIAQHYSKLAMGIHPELPKQYLHLAWLDIDSAEGQEYWKAMELMGEYAAANHELIHRHICKNLGAEVIADIENHHNFAWREEHFDQRVIVHRKGATPANKGMLGIIPGSMATAGYVVRGKGNRESLSSAAHGAGRKMSRKEAKARFKWADAKRFLNKHGVTLISAGLDEVPMAYKDIEVVMASQLDLVEPIARFEPKLVKMAKEGEHAED